MVRIGDMSTSGYLREQDLNKPAPRGSSPGAIIPPRWVLAEGMLNRVCFAQLFKLIYRHQPPFDGSHTLGLFPGEARPKWSEAIFTSTIVGRIPGLPAACILALPLGGGGVS